MYFVTQNKIKIKLIEQSGEGEQVTIWNKPKYLTKEMVDDV